ncbi:hypothetical protein AB0L70_37000 [Kribbella sp. NPDC051952]|uniref:hypothetical protein n=1 Tax=Kribbella sp. NPDC051952 TaxID=3154851 RepID=UPI003444E7CD
MRTSATCASRLTTMLRDVKHPRDDLIETLRRLDTSNQEVSAGLRALLRLVR